MHIDLYNAKYLDHLNYNLNILVCQGQGWDVMQDIKLYPLSLASEMMQGGFTALSCNEPSVQLQTLVQTACICHRPADIARVQGHHRTRHTFDR